jgi:hypothetical protein
MTARGVVVVLAAAGVLVAVGCDKKRDGGQTGASSASVTSSSSASASSGASASASASAAASHPGACKQLLAEKATRCDAMAKGDPTIESACKEAIDRMSNAGDDGRCWTAMNPPEAGPPQDDVPE